VKSGAAKEGAALGLLAPLSIWALHFLATYVTAAIHCAKAGDPGAASNPVRSIVLVLTIAALVALALVLYFGYRRLWPGRRVSGSPARGDRIEANSSQFFRTLLLWTSVLSTVAIACVASVTFVFGDCR
jgi:hypothetical protein